MSRFNLTPMNDELFAKAKELLARPVYDEMTYAGRSLVLVFAHFPSRAFTLDTLMKAAEVCGGFTFTEEQMMVGINECRKAKMIRTRQALGKKFFELCL